MNLFGSNPTTSTALKMTYAGVGEALKLTMEEGGVVIRCSVRTQIPDTVRVLCSFISKSNVLQILDFDFNNEQVITRIKIKPETLREALADLDVSSNVVSFSVDKQRLRLSTKGELGHIDTDFPAESPVMEMFVVEKENTNK